MESDVTEPCPVIGLCIQCVFSQHHNFNRWTLEEVEFWFVSQKIILTDTAGGRLWTTVGSNLRKSGSKMRWKAKAQCVHLIHMRWKCRPILFIWTLWQINPLDITIFTDWHVWEKKTPLFSLAKSWFCDLTSFPIKYTIQDCKKGHCLRCKYLLMYLV